MNTIITRSVVDGDWVQINQLASNDVQEADHSRIDDQWTQNRRTFTGERRHIVLETASQIVAYCSLERELQTRRWRAFVVLDWSGDRIYWEAAYRALDGLMMDVAPAEVWMRELTGDLALLEFMASKGFLLESPFVHDGLEMVYLRRRIDE
ncbi:MAG: hypothetical protein AAF525_19815 [Pseudomonadota bacterium]